MALPSRDLDFTFLSPSSAPRPGAAKKRTRTSPARRAASPVSTSRRRRSAMPILRPISSSDVALALSANSAQRAQQRIAQLRRDDGGSSLGPIGRFITTVTSPVGEFGMNIARGAAPIVPGLSRLIYEQSKDLGQMALSPLPGIDFAPAARRTAERTVGLAKGIGEDIGYTFGPILEGDLGTAARRFYNDPVRTFGTVALAVPVAGGVAGAAARAGGRAGSTSLARFGSKKTTREGLPEDAPNPRRMREPERIEVPAATVGGEPQAIMRSRRPRSANPLTREFQKYVSDPIIAGTKKALGSVGGKKNPLSPERRFQRASERGTLKRTYDFVNEFDQVTAGSAAPLAKIVRKVPAFARRELGKRKEAPVVYAAVALRAMGLNNLSKTQPNRRWGADSMVETWQKRLDEGRFDGPAEQVAIQKNIDTLQKIPDEWLDPDTAPKMLNDYVRETERVLDESTDFKVNAGAITPDTAEFAKRRAQYVAAGVFQNADKARKAVAKKVAAEARVAKLETTVAGKKTAVARAKASGDAKAITRATNSLKQKEKELRTAKQQVNKEKRVAAAEQKIVNSRISPEMKPGSYFPSVEAVASKRSKSEPVAGATSRQRMPDVHKNEGMILRRGTISFAPDVTLGALRDAADVALRTDAFTEVVQRYAIKGENGAAITGQAAVNAAKYHPDLYEAVQKKDLMRMLASQEGKETYRDLAQLIDNAQFPDHMYLIPKSALRGWRTVLGNRRNVIDTMNQMWKAGVLALSPRWYIQNIVGNSLQFALGAGLDLQAIRMAFSTKYRDSVLADIDAHGISAELGELARREGLRPSRNPLRRIINLGYRINARFEAIPRRAMYYHVAKKRLKEEGLAGFGTNAAALSEAWLNVGNAAKRGEQWANDLVEAARIETTRFMGEYTRYNRFERTVMRRAFPFYGWMRTIWRLALSLPVKHPKRAGLVAAIASASYYMYNDDESELMDPYGGLVDGERFIQTSILLPQETLSEGFGLFGRVASKLAEGDITGVPGAVTQGALRQASPLLTAPVTFAAGRTGLNVPYMFASGDGNEIPDPRNPGRTYSIDPITGNRIDVTKVPSVSRFLEQQFPLAMSGARLLSPLNTTLSSDKGLEDVLLWRLRGSPQEEAQELFIPRSPTSPNPLERSRLGDISGILAGVPVYNYNPRMAAYRRLKEDAELAKAMITNEKRRRESGYLLTR